MDFFLDTANLDQIREGVELGIIDGVTTNPSLMAKEGIKGEAAIHAHYRAICELVGGDVSAEVISTDYDGMLARSAKALADQAEEFHNLARNIVVKIPCTKDGIRAICKFTDELGIRTNCTLVFSLGQALLAAKAGATYVSPFVGRLDDVSEDGIALVRDIVNTYTAYAYDTQVIAASIRHTRHIIQCLEANADVATCPLSAILGLLNHPLTDIGIVRFLDDYKKVNG